MKATKLLAVVIVVLAGSVVLLGQTAPNFENGFKPFGSYEVPSTCNYNALERRFPRRGEKWQS